ncbi:MAG: inorganic phosphate transporter [Methanomicrobiales archaeon]|nr:inorganic phosphate transporter [Methanomicrobiales archaeon]MDI6877483.1 inorganic phosphate transporter [Methanomicrobiales archaeon]
METVIILGIVLALLFNFFNGMNDAANAIATVVTTKVLTPMRAVALAAFFNLVGPLLFTTAIAKTIGRGIVDPAIITPAIILAGLVGGIVWVFITTRSGIPVSATHALIGGLMGAAIANHGMGAVLWPSLDYVAVLIAYGVAGALAGALVFGLIARWRGETWSSYAGIGALFGFALIIPLLILGNIVQISGLSAIVIFMVVSPTLGFIAAFLMGVIVIRQFRNGSPTQLNSIFRRLQLFSASLYSFGHGSNDAQNAMGIITAMLVAGGLLADFTVPIWVIVVSAAAISLGTFLGGWSVIETMGKKITSIRPYQGFCAETAGGVVLSFVTAFGVPVSTTHAISGSIMGVGATRGYSAVKWGIVREIVMAWIITIPTSAMVGWIAATLYLRLFG